MYAIVINRIEVQEKLQLMPKPNIDFMSFIFNFIELPSQLKSKMEKKETKKFNIKE